MATGRGDIASERMDGWLSLSLAAMLGSMIVQSTPVFVLSVVAFAVVAGAMGIDDSLSFRSTAWSVDGATFRCGGTDGTLTATDRVVVTDGLRWTGSSEAASYTRFGSRVVIRSRWGWTRWSMWFRTEDQARAFAAALRRGQHPAVDRQLA